MEIVFIPHASLFVSRPMLHAWDSKKALESGLHAVVLGFPDCLSVQLGVRIPDT